MRNQVLKMAVAAAALPFALAGCATFHQAHMVQTQAKQSIASYQPPKQPAVVSMVNTPYLMGSVVDVRHRVPAVLKQPITLVSSNPLTIREIGARISQLTGVPVHIDNLMSQKNATGASGMLPPLPSTSAGIPSFGGASNGASGYARAGVSLNWNGSVAG
ncbi:hypothetical protein HAP67_15550, partial [Acidithiobacillus albertensis]|nr:hypothetical protein [Acidithiobacillus albertensis]